MQHGSGFNLDMAARNGIFVELELLSTTSTGEMLLCASSVLLRLLQHSGSALSFAITVIHGSRETLSTYSYLPEIAYINSFFEASHG